MYNNSIRNKHFIILKEQKNNYCSETYYGGKRSKYNVVEFIKYLSDTKSFNNCKQVVWGGGEPTLDKSFELIINEIDNDKDEEKKRKRTFARTDKKTAKQKTIEQLKKEKR